MRTLYLFILSLLFSMSSSDAQHTGQAIPPFEITRLSQVGEQVLVYLEKDPDAGPHLTFYRAWYKGSWYRLEVAAAKGTQGMLRLIPGPSKPDTVQHADSLREVGNQPPSLLRLPEVREGEQELVLAYFYGKQLLYTAFSAKE